MSKSWRYKLDTSFVRQFKQLNGIEFTNEWVDIRSGQIVIRKDYAWDGCSPSWNVPGTDLWLGTPDGPRDTNGRPQSFYASLVHDVFCQFIDTIPIKKETTLSIFAQLLKEGGFPAWRVWVYVNAVRLFGPQGWLGDKVVATA